MSLNRYILTARSPTHSYSHIGSGYTISILAERYTALGYTCTLRQVGSDKIERVRAYA